MGEVKISKWGNSSAIRLPKAMLDELGLREGSVVDLSVENGKAVIQPKRPENITLEWIISEMKRLGPENEPPTVDWGPDIGSERFWEYE